MDNNIIELVIFEEWLKERNISSNTSYIYIAAVKKFLLQIPKPNLEDINSYNDFIFEHSIKKRSFYYYDALKQYIKFKLREPGKANNIIRALIKPRVLDPKRNIRFLDDKSRDEVISLIKDYKHRIIARIQNSTGVRAGDVFRLPRGSISYEAYDDDTIVMRIDFIGKGKKHFVKWIFDPSIQIAIDIFIKSNYLDGDYYFLEKQKSNGDSSLTTIFRSNYHRYWDDLKQALKTAGVTYTEFSSHDFRRSLARAVWNETKDPVVLKEILNHEDFNTTLRYLRGSGLQTKDVYRKLDQNKRKQ